MKRDDAKTKAALSSILETGTQMLYVQYLFQFSLCFNYGYIETHTSLVYFELLVYLIL